MTPTQQMIVALLEDPSRENYLRLWEAVTTAPDYAPYDDPYSPIETALEAGDNDAAKAAVIDVISRWALSPRIHMLASITAQRLGDEEQAKFEAMFCARCIHAMLATGDGSTESPYLVTCTADEYDLLSHLGKELETQSLAQEGETTFDVMKCKDGSEIHFDVTRVINSLSGRGE